MKSQSDATEQVGYKAKNLILPVHGFKNFVSAAGIYTAPYKGTYQFSVHLQAFGDVKMRILVNAVPEHIDDDGALDFRSTTILLALNAGDQVYITRMSDSASLTGHPDFLYTYFSGFLVSSN